MLSRVYVGRRREKTPFGTPCDSYPQEQKECMHVSQGEPFKKQALFFEQKAFILKQHERAFYNMRSRLLGNPLVVGKVNCQEIKLELITFANYKLTLIPPTPPRPPLKN